MTVAPSACGSTARLVDADDARRSRSFDHGLTVGDGVFETLQGRSAGGRSRVRRHLERLRRSARRPRARRAAVRRRAAGGRRRGGRRRRARPRPGCASPSPAGSAPLGSGRGGGPPTLVVVAGPLAAVAAEATVGDRAVAPQRARRALAGRQDDVLRRERRRPGRGPRGGRRRGDLRQHPRATCARAPAPTCSSVVDGALVTPPLSSGCLAGVTRALVLEVVPEADEDDVPIDALAEADEVLPHVDHPGRPADLRMLDGRAAARRRRARGPQRAIDGARRPRRPATLDP